MRPNRAHNRKLSTARVIGLLVALALFATQCLEAERIELDVKSQAGIVAFTLPAVVAAQQAADTSTGTTGTPGTIRISSFQTTIQEGQLFTHQVRLEGTPTADVTVTFSASTGMQFSPASLTFTPENASTDQNVTVLVTDNAQRGTPNLSATVSYTATSTDTLFNNVTAQQSLTVTENDRFMFSLVTGVTGTPGNNMNGVLGADALCNASANRPDTSVTYKALIAGDYNSGGSSRRACSTTNCNCSVSCDATQGSDWVLTAGYSYYQADQTFIGLANAAGIFFGGPTGAFKPAPGGIWFGFTREWLTSNDTCRSGGNSWTVSSGLTKTASSGQTGLNALPDTSPANSVCTATTHLVCVEQ